jgi:hypothetical protein
VQIIREEYREGNMPIVLKIPSERRMAEEYSRGMAPVDACAEWRCSFWDVYGEAGRRALQWRS